MVHSAMPRGWGSARGRVLGGALLGVLTWFVGPGLVDEVLAAGAGRQVRFRAVPARVGVYFVLGLCLFSDLPYGQVLREMTCGLEGRLAAAGWRVPSATALTAARRRVGERPLELLFGRVCSALTPGRDQWSHLCGLLAVAWDGTTIAVAATPANIAAFGQLKGPNGGHFPQLRAVALIACGTRALLGAAIGPVTGRGAGEQNLARQVLGALGPGMLLLADRNFYSYRLWNDAAATGADLLWRAKSSLRLTPVRELPDGSFLARVNDPRAVTARKSRNGKRRSRGSALAPDTGPLPGMTVRVIEFWLTVTAPGRPARTERYRLLTTVTRWQAAPAADLAAGYARRWAIETGYQELKTWLRGPRRTLRPRTPDLARQELWAYLITYQAIRAIIARTAAASGLDPARISFTATLHAARRTLPAARTSMTAALAQTETEILTSLQPRREGRVFPRAVSQPRSPYPSRHRPATPVPHHATYTITTTRPPATTRTPAHQPGQPPNPPQNPP